MMDWTGDFLSDEQVFTGLLQLAKDNIVTRRGAEELDTFYEYLILLKEDTREIGRVSFWEGVVSKASLLEEAELTVYKYGVKLKDNDPNIVLFYRDRVMLRREVLRPLPEEGSSGHVALVELKDYLESL